MRATTRADDERLLRMLDMHVVQDLTAKDIAQRLGVSRATVCGNMHRVRSEDVARHGERIAWAYRRGAGARSPDWHWSQHARGRR